MTIFAIAVVWAVKPTVAIRPMNTLSIIVSDKAIFVVKRDVKLQLTN